MIKIGLEIHAQLLTKAKLFSGPIGCISPLDIAMPGYLPILNHECVEKAVKASLLFGCTVNKISKFDRKHYFYKDLPLGYQITQYYQPLAIKGSFSGVRIERVQLEQDTAKVKADMIDYTRAGRGLIEIVTGPDDLKDSKETEDFCRNLSMQLNLHDISSGRLEDGSLRVDVNISLHDDLKILIPRVEVKNIMGFRFIAKAIEGMKQRMEEAMEDKCEIPKGTWMFDQKTRTVRFIREKTRKEDYQYFPDPELEPLCVSDLLLDQQYKSIKSLDRNDKEKLVF